MKLKKQEERFIELGNLRPGECFCFANTPEVYLMTDYQGEGHLCINIETGETMWILDGLERMVISVQVEATVKRYSDSKEGSVR